MKNLTTFLNIIREKSHVKFIQETTEERLFLVLEIQIDERGKLSTSAYYEDFKNQDGKIEDIEEIKKYQFGPLADEVNYRIGIVPGYDVKTILASVIASDFSNKKCAFTSANELSKPNQDVLDYLYTVAIKLLSISSHSLVCSHCTNDNYLTKYLLESEENNKEDFQGVTLEDVEYLEDKLIERFNEVKTTGETLSNKETSKEEFLPTAYKWIELYENRKNLSLKCI